jgi:hypothetical protein
MKFLISEQEKQRILEMHQSATSRQYLMEEEVATNYFNTMKTKFDGQMVAYKLPTITLQLNNNGTISIVKDGKAVYTSTVSPDVPTLSQAITYNDRVKGTDIPTAKLNLLSSNLIDGYTNYVKSTPDAKLTLAPVTGALRSAVMEVVNTYFKNKQPAQPK